MKLHRMGKVIANATSDSPLPLRGKNLRLNRNATRGGQAERLSAASAGRETAFRRATANTLP